MKVKKLTFFLFCQLFLSCFLFGQETQNAQVYFASDQYQLTEEARSTLDQLIEQTTQAAAFHFSIKGHTDKDGSHLYNERLSSQRSDAVKNYLFEQGIQSEQVSIAAFGERQPVNHLGSEEGKAANRRVEIQLEYTIIESLEEMYAHFARKRDQHFTLDLSKTNRLAAQHGTIVNIPPHAFIHPDGQSLEGRLVDLKIEEAIRPSAMVFHQLNTVHGENALSTGGMVRLTASVDGVPLQLKAGKAIDVFVPTEAANPDMNLYAGRRDSTGQMEWDELEEPVQILDGEAVMAASEPQDFPEELLSMLNHIEIEIPEHPGKLNELPLPALLKKPEPTTIKMEKPYRPGLPKRQISHAPKGLFAKMKYDKVAEQRKLDEQYEKRMEQYENRMLAYGEAMKAYKINAKMYQAELDEIDRQYIIDNAVVIEKRRAMVNDYFENCYAFEAGIRINNQIKDFKDGLTPKTIHSKLYPNFNERKLPVYFFNYSLVATEYMVKGEEMPRWDDNWYSEYRSGVNREVDRLAISSGYIEALRKMKKVYGVYQNQRSLELKKKSNSEYRYVDQQIQYYGFKITQPDPYWCNIDTPIPLGKELIVFENSHLVEMFTFCPERKSVSYFPSNVKKSALYNTGEPLKYLAFQFAGQEVQLAKGSLIPSRRTQVGLDFQPSSLAAVEEAILALDL